MIGCTSTTQVAPPDQDDVVAGEEEQGRQAEDDDHERSHPESASQPIDYQSIEEAESFSDGVAWVTRYDGTRAVVDLDGNVLFEPDEHLGAVSPYVNGVSLVWNGNNSTETARLIDKTGNTVWSVEEDGLAKAEDLYGADAVNRVSIQNPFAYDAQESWHDELWRGYTIVRFDIDSFEYTGILAGLLGPDGAWVIEPPALEEAAAHAGDRVWDLGNDGYGDSGTYDRYTISLKHQGLLIYRTGEILPYTGLDSGGINGLSYGNMWQDDINEVENYAAHHNCRYVGGGRFEDSGGNVVLELEEDYPLYSGGFLDGPIQEDSFVDSEYCLVYLENEGGGKYFTVIDMQGNRMFDPMRAGTEGLLRGGAFFHKGKDEEVGRYYTISGDPLGDVSGEEGKPFVEGRAWIMSDGYWRCIDDKGNVII